MPHMPYSPILDGYSLEPGTEYIVHQVDGGLPRARRVRIGTPVQVDATWKLTATEYMDWWKFYKDEINYGTDPFAIEVDIAGAIATRTAMLTAGSVSVTPPDVATYIITATLLIAP